MDLINLVRKEMLRRNYSRKSIKTYVQCLKQFLRVCHKEPRRITKSDIKDYLTGLAESDKSGSTLNVHLNAIKFATKEILNKKWVVGIRFSKAPRSLPVVLSKAEVLSIISCIGNFKHRLIVQLMYSAGLRVEEVVRLRRADFEFDHGFGWVRGGKGRKDRMFIIADSISGELRDYVLQCGSWVFPGRNGPLTVRSVQEVVRRAARDARIWKKVHPHTFRHSFATHLIEDGYAVSVVQSLLGHSSPSTTRVYVRTARPTLSVKSPLD